MRIFDSFFLTLLILFPSVSSASPTALNDGPILIATQPTEGSAFTIESTLFTVLDGATNLQQDLVLSSDNQLVVFPDIYLDPKTNVKEVYPDRARKDGRYYLVDFTLNELRALQLKSEDGQYLMGLEEQLALLKRLQQRTGKVVGIFPRLIKTWFHRSEGRDICGITLTVLKQHGYFSHQAPVYLQSYDTDELKRAHEILMPMMQTDIKLIQLIDTKNGNEMMTDGPFPAPINYDWIYTGFGMRSLATYVDGIGFTWQPPENEMKISQLGELFDQAAKLHLTIQVEINHSPELPAADADQKKTGFAKLLDTMVHKLDVKAVKTDDIKSATIFFNQKQSETPTIQEILPQLINRGQSEGAPPAQSPLTILRELQ